MVDVFISYSRRDQPVAAMLAHAIEAEGYSVWWDEDLPPHQSYGDVITAKIAEAKAAVVLWSADAAQSEWVRAEADMARNQRKLVQTALNDVMPPLPFNQIQFAQIGGWDGGANHAGWRKVKASLAELCGEKREDGPHAGPLPTASPPPAPQATARASRWPIFAGIGVAALALAIAGGVILGRGGSTSADQPTAAASPEAAPAATGIPAPAATSPQPVSPNEQRAASRADMTLPDSSTRLLTESDVAGFGPATLRIARTEIYARLGQRFTDPELHSYFSQFPWYRPTADTVKLNPIEQRNVALLQKSEARFQ